METARRRAVLQYTRKGTLHNYNLVKVTSGAALTRIGVALTTIQALPGVVSFRPALGTLLGTDQ